MKVPKVSIIIPVYNGSKFIEQAIQTALAQDYKNFELVVLDNASTDNTFELASKYKTDSRLKLFKNDSNVGMFRNFNKAFSLSAGEYIKFMCVDDFLEPDAISKMAACFEEDEKVSLVRMYSKNIDSEGKVLDNEKIIYRGKISGNFIIFKSCLIMTNHYCATPSHMMYRRNLFEKTGTFEEIDDFKGWANDFFSCMKMLHNNKNIFS